MDELIVIQMSQQQKIDLVVRKYGKKLMNFIRSRVNNKEDAEDIIQDVWIKLFTIVDSEPIEQLSSWLFRVSKNRIIDKQRKYESKSIEDFTFEDEDGSYQFPDHLFAHFTTPDQELEKKQFMETFFEAIEELPEKQRIVFVSNELDDLTLQEIANREGENLKTIISRKRYAVAYLRKRLEMYYQ